MELIDKQYMETPFYGRRKMTQWLREQGHDVNPKRVARLMKLMRVEAIYPKPRTSLPSTEHKIYPYLLRNLEINRPDFVWCTDITYIPMQGGFIYLVAVMDWFSRYVLSWQLSNTMDTQFCIDALEMALCGGKPQIFNSDQGSQFTADAYTSILKNAGIQISMDGRGRYLDNIFIERLWRSLKYENIFLWHYETVPELEAGLEKYFDFYNNRRFHQSLGYCKPVQLYRRTATHISA
jgi:putative transposase